MMRTGRLLAFSLCCAPAFGADGLAAQTTPEHKMSSNMPMSDMGVAPRAVSGTPTPDIVGLSAVNPDDPLAGIGTLPPPAAPKDWAADHIFDPTRMAAARAALRQGHGAERVARIGFNLAEIRVGGGKDGYRWEGEGWYGGDIDRFVAKTEGDGRVHGDGSGELRLLYSHAIAPTWDMQAGIRQDFGAHRHATSGAFEIEGLVPYNLEFETSVYVSRHGNMLGRIEGWYDERISERWLLQPRVELNFAAQSLPKQQIGAGLSTAELGLRLRYQITPRFEPYAGFSWERPVGATARYADALGDRNTDKGIVVGLATWF